jgi:hypothetical protein
LDVNFDGTTPETLTDQPDWSSLNLAQIGGRTNFGALSVGDFATDAGDFATDAGSLATNAGDYATDAGSRADNGDYATDAGDFATDAGGFATDAGGTDVDYDTHQKSTTDGIPKASQCPGCGLKAVNELNDILLSWIPPDTGGGITYNIYRCVVSAGSGCTPVYPPFVSNFKPASQSSPTFTDTVNDFVHSGSSCPAGKTCYNTFYVYKATVVSSQGPESGDSNFTDAREVTHLFVIADNQTVVYGSPNPTPTFQISGDINGALLNSQVTCSYPALTPRNAGTYTITCAGPATVTSTNGVTYNAQYLIYVPGILTINPRPITVTATTDTRTYDGTTNSSQPPGYTALAYTDTPGFTQSFDSRNAGSRTLIPTGKVNDQNNGNNYTYTYTNTAGTINQLALTVTAKADSKTYDGTATSSKSPDYSPALGLGDSSGFTQVFDSRNAGSRQLIPSGKVGDGNNGNNYTYTYSNTAGSIAPLALTVTAASDTKIYGGTTASSKTPGYSPNLGTGDTAGFGQVFDSRNAGNRQLIPSGVVNDGNSGSNYTYNFVNTAGSISPLGITVTARTDSRVYDGTTNSSQTPTYPGLATGDTTANFTQVFDSRNAGSRQLIPSGVVNDGNSGSNYSYNFVRTPGTITQRALTGAIAANNKQYDSTQAATLSGSSLSPPIQGDKVTLVVGTPAFTDKNAGNGKTVLAALSLTGDDALNYTVNSPASTTANITPAPLAIKADDKQVAQNAANPIFTATYTTLLGTDTPASLTGTLTFDTTRTLASLPGTYPINVSGQTSTNYTITYAPGVLTVQASPISFTDFSAPGNLLTLNGNAQYSGSVLRLSSGTNQNSSAWYTQKQAVANGFSSTFTFKITPVTPGEAVADGFAFVIQNAGTNALGTSGQGGYLGYQGISSSLAIEFDTFFNSGGQFNDPNGNHVAIQSGGTGPNSVDHNSTAKLDLNALSGITLADGNVHTVSVVYAAGTLTVTIDNTQVLSTTKNLSTLLGLDSGTAYVGFTAATGSDRENSDILSWTFTPTN